MSSVPPVESSADSSSTSIREIRKARTGLLLEMFIQTHSVRQLIRNIGYQMLSTRCGIEKCTNMNYIDTPVIYLRPGTRTSVHHIRFRAGGFAEGFSFGVE